LPQRAQIYQINKENKEEKTWLIKAIPTPLKNKHTEDIVAVVTDVVEENCHQLS
jgi:hypothetical protein